MSHEDEMTPFEIELVTAIRRLTYGGVDGPTGIEALTMALGGEGTPGTYSISAALSEIAEALNHVDVGGNELSISEFGGRNGENYILGLTQGLDSIANAIVEHARSQNRANAIVLIERLGIKFDAEGDLKDHDEHRLITAQRRIAEIAELVQSDGH